MRKTAFILGILLSSYTAISKDTLRVYFSIGVSLNSYWTNSLKLSNDKFGIRIGARIEKKLPNRFSVCGIFWLQNTKITKLETNIFDSVYKEAVYISTNINLHRLNFGTEIYREFRRFKYGFNGGISYILKSNIDQEIIGGTGVSAINIYNKYVIYNTQGNSIYRVINPYVGLSFLFSINKFLVLKYENNLDVFSNPNNNYQFYRKFNIIHNTISINLKIK